MKSTLKILIRIFCMLALTAGIFHICPVQALTKEKPSPDGQQTVTDIYINPEYEEILSEADFLSEMQGRIPSDNEIQSVSDDRTITSADQALELVRDIMTGRIETGSINVNIPKSQIPEVAESRYLFRWLVRQTVAHNGIPDQGDYLMYQYGGFTASYSWYPDTENYRGIIKYQIKYYTNLDQEKAVTAWINEVMPSLNLEGLHDIEKIRRIYKYICSHFEYDYDNLYNSNDYLKYTAYGGITRGKMVCQGYSNLLYRMLLEAGIDTRIISGMAGNSGNERHAWNIIELDGQYYNADSTWDANYDDNESRYMYFLKNMTEFARHSRGSTAANFNYDYDSEAFSAAYPMADLSYVAAKQIMFDPVSLEITDFGVRTQIPYTVIPANATIQSAQISVENDDILHFSGPYWISAWRNGDTSVTVTLDDGLISETLQVHAALEEKVGVTGVLIDTDELKIKVNNSYGLAASVEPSNASDQRIFWTSSDPETVSVNGDGVITGLKRGTAVITAASGSGLYNDECIITVFPDPERFAGEDRFDTSMKIAEAFMQEKNIDKLDSVIMASGIEFADALAGSYLSYVKNAPILITWEGFEGYTPYEQINAFISANVKEGGTIYVLGGEEAVKPQTLAGLEKFNIKRLAGENRFETNLKILEETKVSDQDILVATGMNFADSLSASAVNRPILLVWEQLFDMQKDYLKTLKGNDYYLLGGEKAVTKDIAKELAAYGKVERLAGSDRHETSVLIAETFCPDAERAVLALSTNFPDGLCGGPLASATNAPLILTHKDDYSAAKAHCRKHTILYGYVLGGDSLVTDSVVRDIFNSEAEIIRKG